METVFLSHNGMTEALGQRQVLPYLRGLAGAGVRIHLFASEPLGADPAAVRAIAAVLAPQGILYTPLRRRPSHRMGDKARDCGQLFMTALRTLRRERVRPRIVHARGHLPSAAAKLLCSVLPGARFIFDFRGLLAEEYADLGHWRRDELRYRLTGAVERQLLRRADRVVVLTEALRQEFCAAGGPLSGRTGDVMVIPCCVDLARFRPDPQARRRSRAQLGLAVDTVLLIFAGSFSRYDLEATARFLRALRRHRDARLLLLTQDDPQRFHPFAQTAGCAEAVRSLSAPPEQVPEWLCGADAAVSLLRDCRSSLAASPTKIAEALGAGLPTVISQNVVDYNRLSGAGILPVLGTDDDALDRAAQALLGELADPEQARAGSRQTAARHFSLENIGVARYRALYEQLS